MIPIQLTLQGIYSYQEKQTIDFNRLTEANIFGIFGSVGSGKSTILEAITYTLYGRTDRLNLSGDNRNYNMMNLKSNELAIEFIFKTGKDDSEYMATVKSRRNSKQFDDVKALDRAAYKKVKNEWLPIPVDSLETIIGLNYENFKRTIIIPQGKFQEFLQLGNKERTQMMKELFNLNKFELYYKVVSLETKNNQQIQNLEGKLQQIGEINPNQLKEDEDAILLAKKEIESKSLELSQKQEQENKLQKLKDLVSKIKELELTLTNLKEQEPSISLLEKNIREYEYCQLNFKNLLDSTKEISIKIEQFTQNIRKDNSALENITAQLLDLEKNYETIKNDFDNRESLKQQSDELVKISKLRELKNSATAISDRILKGETINKEIIEKISHLKESQNTLTNTLKEKKSQYPDMALLSQVKNWFTINKTLTTTQKDLDLEINSVQSDLQETDKQKSLLWKIELFNDISQTLNFKEVAIIFENRKLEIKSSLDNLNIKMEHLSLQSKLEEYAANLVDGKPCPLCGALTHPQPLNVQNVSEAIQNTRIQKSNYEKTIASIEQSLKKLAEIETVRLIKVELLEKVLQKQKEHIDKTSNHQKLFTWNNYVEVDSVTKEFAMAEQLQIQLKKLEGELEKLSLTLDEENRNKDIYNSKIEELRHQLTANSSESATLAKQIIQLRLEDFENKTSEDIYTLINSILKKYKEIGTLYETTSNKINILHKEKDIICGRLQANQKTLELEITSQTTVASKTQEQLSKSEYTSIQEVQKILAQIIPVEKDKKKISEFRQTMTFTEKQLSMLHGEIGEQKYDTEQHQLLKISITQITEELKHQNQNLGKLNSELKKLKEDLETQKYLRELVSTLQTRAEDIKTLKQLFKASGFVNYISSVYLHDLCSVANTRFYKLTRQKLSIEVTEDNNFQVRDFMNGGKTRNVKTLSGGQTFQAALSLALALADNIQKITESSQNFFFLDEGFGSLDKESLETVFETLKSLGKENRIVGVISHIEEMQQEIDTHLKIENIEEKGSIIHTSWN